MGVIGGVPKFVFALDMYRIYEFQKDWAKRIKADVVFSCQKDWTERFIKDGFNAVWMPVCCDPYYHKPIDTPIINDVSFVGGMNMTVSKHRYDRLNLLANDGLKVDVHTQDDVFPGYSFQYQKHRAMLEDYSKIVCQSKFHFTATNAKDLEMRHFETLSMGRPILTDDCPGLKDLFDENDGVYVYGSDDDMLIRARYICDNNEEVLKKVVNGQKKVLENHTYLKRLEQMLEEAKKL